MADAPLAYLAPCPFCGGQAAEQKHDSDHWIECTQCGVATLQFTGVRKAIGAWNRRLSPPVAAPAGIDAGALVMLIAAARSGDPGTIKLATILAGVPPCDDCGYVKTHCRCASRHPTTPTPKD